MKTTTPHNEAYNQASATRRQLTSTEIEHLKNNGCRCRDWSLITAAEPFSPECYRGVVFSGEVSLGRTDKELIVAGIPQQTGIYDAAISNCSIGDNCYIANIRGSLLNLDIDDDVIIDSAYSIISTGDSCFGNDVKINVMCETGGREVTANVAMTAQLAYLIAFYRHNALLSKALEAMGERFAAKYHNSRAHIGRGAQIIDCREICDVNIHDGAVINGATRLRNGTVCSAYVGAGVIAEDFIIQDEARVDSGAKIHGCLVGHCAEVNSGFTAHDTILFSKSRLENGESASAFCGPFTTSMHKSSLLIGGLFSFFNAGSGTNQSNHMYKLGPMHQGALARGCRTGSDSYLIWPATIGAFTTIVGRHYYNPDTRLFPFSYLVNDPTGKSECQSLLIPGATAGSVGLARDVEKWPARIGGAAQDDLINFNWLSPLTIGNILKALVLLKQWDSETTDSSDPLIKIQGCVIPRRSVPRGIIRYERLVKLYAGGVFRRKILSMIATTPEMTAEQLIERLRQKPSGAGSGQWVDICGMLTPRESIDALCQEIIANEEMTIEDVCARLREIHARYSAYSWCWAWNNLQSFIGIDFSTITIEQLSSLLKECSNAAEELEERFTTDAAKEFDPERASLGFGIDAGDNRQEILDDFERVRGTLSSQRFLAMLHRRVATFTGSIKNIITILEQPAK